MPASKKSKSERESLASPLHCGLGLLSFFSFVLLRRSLSDVCVICLRFRYRCSFPSVVVFSLARPLDFFEYHFDER